MAQDTQPTGGDFSRRVVRAFDLEDSLGRVQRLIKTVMVCQEAEAPKSEALTGAIDALSNTFDELEAEIMGNDYVASRKDRIRQHNNDLMDYAMWKLDREQGPPEAMPKA